MKLLVVCGSGLGSSFMVEMNINDILKEFNVENIEVNHTDLGSATSDMADVFIAGRDMEEGISSLGKTVILDNILDKEELKARLESLLKEKQII
ncbi:PTS system IIB component (L-Asc family) [Scopulibacillus darangshiensis]|uniref:PTS system IIB component (L-Asc family) n=1 Tax=Scopulibacillus darangshiensis TaxID=442528 RepID=A0A4R2P1M2_9BACL|nr:PTS sugar transporter subunit IIB [Scopulibacillus darangshiensis]TCP27834.1 PTS system IIB component (L-Asc family) [Scopulibacillus darangshiensis]